MISVQPTWYNTNEHRCCVLAGLPWKVFDKIQPDSVGLGSVLFCRELAQWPACDPYPDWLPWGREIYKSSVPEGSFFYKPMTYAKEHFSCIRQSPPDYPWVASEIKFFVHEWRAYVVQGKVLRVYCYSDFDDDTVHEFPWKVPDNITAAIDFGLTNDGKLLPVEVNDPYSIGWYGSTMDWGVYSTFVVKGWEYMCEKG